MSFQVEIDEAIKSKRLYFVGDSLPLDWYCAFRQWLPLAEAGDSKAQFNIGRCYARGDGIEQDKYLSEEWLLKAAVQNEPRSHFNLHLHYEELKNSELSENWLQKAASLSEARALKVMDERMRYTGLKALEEGNKSKAKSIFTLLFEKGDLLSKYGQMLCDVEVNFKNIRIRKTYRYTADVQTNPDGYVTGGGSRTGVYYNHAVEFQVTNRTKYPARVSLKVAHYDFKNPQLKLEDYWVNTPVINPGETSVATHEILKKRCRIFYVGIAIFNKTAIEKNDDGLGYHFSEEVLVWEPKPLFGPNIMKTLLIIGGIFLLYMTLL